jgi:hypothetical protein
MRLTKFSWPVSSTAPGTSGMPIAGGAGGDERRRRSRDEGGAGRGRSHAAQRGAGLPGGRWLDAAGYRPEGGDGRDWRTREAAGRNSPRRAGGKWLSLCACCGGLRRTTARRRLVLVVVSGRRPRAGAGIAHQPTVPAPRLAATMCRLRRELPLLPGGPHGAAARASPGRRPTRVERCSRTRISMIPDPLVHRPTGAPRAVATGRLPEPKPRGGQRQCLAL